ncbi:MAG: hypothetical protein ABI723_21510 [Bacteroidia bacterium]
MKKLKYLTGLLLLMQIYSCNCDKKYNCGALSDDSFTWLNQNINDTMMYENSAGQHYKFVVNSKTISPAYEAQACKHGEVGCGCDYLCEANGGFYAECDSTLNNLKSYSVNIEESGDNKTILSSILTYQIFDFINKIDVTNPSNLNQGDSLLSTLQLGNHTYSNVYVQMIDTLISYNQNKKIWKAYYSKSTGLIGFHDRQSQTLFYRN